MRVRSAVTTLIAPIASMALWAQSPATPPVPNELTSAHTAFLAYAGSATAGGLAHDAVAKLYSSVWQSLNQSPYRLSPSPLNADLFIELSVQFSISNVVSGSSLSGSSLRLTIYDAKTHALLWTVDEALIGSLRKKTADQNAEEAVSRLAADLKQLSQGKLL